MHAGDDIGETIMRRDLDLVGLGGIAENDLEIAREDREATVSRAAAKVAAETLHEEKTPAGYLNSFCAKAALPRMESSRNPGAISRWKIAQGSIHFSGAAHVPRGALSAS